MASIRNRVQTDGSVKFAVLFRERATRKRTSLTYASRVEAERMAAVIEASADLRSAQRVTAASKRKSPLVQDVVLEHISMLTAVAPGQLVRYRNQVRDHLSGPIGVTPVDNLDIKVISGWIQEMQRKGLSAQNNQERARTAVGGDEDRGDPGLPGGQPVPGCSASEIDCHRRRHALADPCRGAADHRRDPGPWVTSPSRRPWIATHICCRNSTRSRRRCRASRCRGCERRPEPDSGTAANPASPACKGSRVQTQVLEVGDLCLRPRRVRITIHRVWRNRRELQDRPHIDSPEHDLGVAEPQMRDLARSRFLPQPPSGGRSSRPPAWG